MSGIVIVYLKKKLKDFTVIWQSDFIYYPDLWIITSFINHNFNLKSKCVVNVQICSSFSGLH